MLKDSLERVRSFSADVQAVMEVAAALEEIGSIDEGIAKAKERLKEVEQTVFDEGEKLKGVLEDLSSTRAQCKFAVEEVKKVCDEANAEAESIAMNVMAKADAVMKDAQAQATEIRRKATTDAAAMIAEARAQMKRIQVEADTAQDVLKSVEDQIAAKQSELDQLNAGLAEVRSKARVFVEG